MGRSQARACWWLVCNRLCVCPGPQRCMEHLRQLEREVAGCTYEPGPPDLAVPTSDKLLQLRTCKVCAPIGV